MRVTQIDQWPDPSVPVRRHASKWHCRTVLESPNKDQVREQIGRSWGHECSGHRCQGIAQCRGREARGEVEFDLHTYELQYHKGATRARGCLNDLPGLLREPLAISMLRPKFSGGVDEVRALVGEEDWSETTEKGELRTLE